MIKSKTKEPSGIYSKAFTWHMADLSSIPEGTLRSL